MGFLSNTQIRQAIDDGHIVCYPFNPDHVNHVSLDVTLGYYFYRIEQQNERTVYNPFDKEDVERYFDGPHKAIAHGEWCKLNGLKPFTNIPPDHPVISLRPGERILAHSHEFIGITAPGAYQISARSSWTRNGLSVSEGSSLVSPGSLNRLTLELRNLNQRETLLLPVGERIAQAAFTSTGEVTGSYGAIGDVHKYQHGTDLETIIKTWSPDMLLPRTYQYERQLPRKIEGLPYE